HLRLSAERPARDCHQMQSWHTSGASSIVPPVSPVTRGPLTAARSRGAPRRRRPDLVDDPVDGGRLDLRHLAQVSRDAALHLAPNSGYRGAPLNLEMEFDTHLPVLFGDAHAFAAQRADAFDLPRRVGGIAREDVARNGGH